jgi:cytochrome c-type biogenesis protein CcmH
MTGRGIFAAAALLVALLAAPVAHAVEPSEMLKDPVLEARARTLSAELRCMVCQNQSIDDSEAPLAADIRVLLRQRLVAGDSDQQVIDYLVDRYGEFILLKPPFNWHTLILWAVPPLVLIAGGLAAFLGYRRRQPAVPRPLDDNERKALDRLLSEEG